MFSVFKELWDYKKLESIDKALQKMKRKHQSLKKEQKRLQEKYEELYLKLNKTHGAVKVGPRG